MATAPNLDTALNFGVLAANGVTNIGNTLVTCKVGSTPNPNILGFPPGVTTDPPLEGGTPLAGQAQTDLAAAYNDAASQPCTTDLTGQVLGTGGTVPTLTPGVYCFTGNASVIGTLTLNGNGVYIFQISGSLTTSPSSTIALAGGAQAGNVFWQVGSTVSLGAGSTFTGNILALSSIVSTGSAVSPIIVNGRLLSRNGSVSLSTNTITCPPTPTPIPTPSKKSKKRIGGVIASYYICIPKILFDQGFPTKIYVETAGTFYPYSEDNINYCFTNTPLINPYYINTKMDIRQGWIVSWRENKWIIISHP